MLIGSNLSVSSVVFAVLCYNCMFSFQCLGLSYYWAAVSALLCLAIPLLYHLNVLPVSYNHSSIFEIN